MLPWTGERFIPAVSAPTLAYEHLHRYRFAREWVKGKRVLDLGCGEGYGCFLMAEEAEDVVGVDIDVKTIRHASAKYRGGNLRFLSGSMTSVPLKGEAPFDVITCFEALEHIAEHPALLREVKRLLRGDGVFLVSTPNKKVYADGTEHRNEFHRKELYFSEFSDLVSASFRNTLFYGQALYCCSNVFSVNGSPSRSMEFVIGAGEEGFEFLPAERKAATYFIAAASDRPLPPEESIGSTYLIDVSDSFNRKRDEQISGLRAAVRKRDEAIERNIARLAEKDARLAELYRALKGQEEEIRRYSALYEEISRSLSKVQAALPQIEALLEDMKACDLPCGLSLRAAELCSRLGLGRGAGAFHAKALERDPSNPQARAALESLLPKQAAAARGGAAAGVECPICEGRFAAFLPMGAVHPRMNAKCPGCGSLERHRLLWLFLKNQTDFFSQPLAVLHVAPEPFFRSAFLRMPNLAYVSTDLHSPLAKVRADLSCLPFRGRRFDVILCSHVLEHVPDDRRAMRELARVLKPDGWAFLQVPVNRRIARTIEDPQVTDPGERERRFGQSDHVRWYGLDFPVRLAEAGLEVRVEPFAERLGPEAAGRYGLVPGEDLYLCRKDSRRPSEGEARAVIR